MKSFKDVIQSGGIGAIRTDTLYGLVADANNQYAVDRIYHIKKRDPLKPCIVLVSSVLDIIDMGFQIPEHVRYVCDQQWPGQVSIIIDAPHDMHMHYLHRGTGGVAFRLPADERVRAILKEVGPLVAPSANPEGQPVAQSVEEAMQYFGDQVDMYVDAGVCIDTSPSRLLRVHNNGDIQILRD